MKKTYSAPELCEYGRIDQLTLGCGNGAADQADYGDTQGDPNTSAGNPGQSCDAGGS